MTPEWRHSAKSVTKYNPVFRDERGHYKNEEWVGFFQVGEKINGELLTFVDYSETENRYITAAKLFFQFHNCTCITIKNLERKDISAYQQADKAELLKVYNLIAEGVSFSIGEIDTVLKLILREMVWAELFCDRQEAVALRFGYDFYMYFSSNRRMDVLIEQVTGLGLFVW